MDPLSITASVASLLSFSAACGTHLHKIIHNLRHAPDEILALSNEITDLNLILADLEATCQSIESSDSPPTQSRAEFNGALTTQLINARSKLIQLNSLGTSLLVSMPDGRTKFRKYTWVRKKSFVVALRRDLVDVKRNIGILLASTTASRSVRIELSLRALNAEASRKESETIQSVQSLSIEYNTHSNEASRESGPMDISQESKPIDTPQESKPIDIPQESKPMDISQESKPIDTPQESKPIDIPQESKPMNIQVSAADHMSMLLETIHQVGQFSAITFHVHRLARCGGHCDCICHSRQEFHSPQFLNNFLGALFVGYAGLPLTTSRCNRPRCTNQYSRTLQVSYTFPLWFLSRTVDIVAAMTFTGKPCFGMSVGNRVEFSSEKSIFQLARLGNIPGIIELFKARKASPNDLAIRGGYTALHWAVELNHVDTVQFLVSVGVDPYVKDDYGGSEAHNISQYVLTAKADNKVARGYESIFNMSSMHSELWDFSYVHQIVLGLLHVDLKIILQNPYYQNEFDSRLDSAGRSPLYWAALIGDPVAVKLLLQAGADCTRRDHEGRTPLYGALQSGNLQCVELLLLARSSVHMKDKYGNTAIQLATLAQDDETILEAIFLAGGSVRTCNNDGVGVMSTAACLDRVRNGTYLLKIGADPEIQDNNGDMALFESLYYNNYRMLDVLLRHGVKFDKKNRFGWTVLHVAALYADLQSLDMLTSNGLKGADVEAKDDKGRTPRQAFDDRPDQLVGLREAFERLLQRVEDFNHDQLEIIEIMDDYEDHSSQSDREFFDSLETLSLDDRGNGDHIGDTPLEVY